MTSCESNNKSNNISNELHQRLNGRAVYIWGAGQQGRGMQNLLERNGIVICGFIDSSKDVQGSTVGTSKVFAPDEILSATTDVINNAPDEPRPFVIIASFFFMDEIKNQCEAYGLIYGRDCCSYKDLKPYDYVVDVSGVCNLRCLACPRASREHKHPPAGYMTAETFEQVLDKILLEDPFVSSIQLYQWGEPLLNPQLPQIIEAANKRQVPCAVSSNLSLNCDLESVIAARPAWFRVSLSGTGQQYEQMHAGASWQQLKDNLQRLANLRDRLNPDMKTEVYYHLYRHNREESLDEAKVICTELGFELHPVWAYLISLDDVLSHLEGDSLSGPALEASGKLAVSLEEGMELARQEKHKDCLVKRCININWDLSVSNCMMFFYPENNIACDNFLETPLAEISRTRQTCDLCVRCQKQALHRYCAVYATLDTTNAGLAK